MSHDCTCGCDRAGGLRRPLTRRGVLAGTAGVTATLALGACAAPEDTAATSIGPAGSGSASSAASSASATASQSQASASASPAKSVSPAQTGMRLAGTSDFPVGGGAIVPTGAGAVVITHPGDDTFAGFNARCPHQGCTVAEVVENTILCTCHGSVFDGTTGDRLEGPAPTGLTPVGIEVDGSEIYLA